MKLKQAIKHLERKVQQNVFQVDPQAFIALKLGIEALKEIHRERIGEIPFIGELLPGETEK